MTAERRAYAIVLARAHFAVGEVPEALAVHETLPDRIPPMTPAEREAWEATGERYRAATEAASE